MKISCLRYGVHLLDQRAGLRWVFFFFSLSSILSKLTRLQSSYALIIPSHPPFTLSLSLFHFTLPRMYSYRPNSTHQNLSQGTAAKVLPPILPKLAKRPAETNAIRDLTPAWSPDVGVLCATWNSGCGIGRAALLASGMACGLARVDFIKGEWKEPLGERDLGALRGD